MVLSVNGKRVAQASITTAHLMTLLQMTKPHVYGIEASPPILNALIKNMHVDDLIYKLRGLLLSSSSKKASKREKEKSPVVHYAHHLNSQDGWICVDQRNNVLLS